MRAGPGDETPAQRRRRREEEERRRRQEEARRRQEQREDASDAVEGAADVVEAGSGLGVPTGLGRGGGRTSAGRSDGGGGGWGCDGWGGGGSRGSGSSGLSGGGGGRGGGSGSGWGCGGGSGGRSGGGGCDGCDCNLSLLAITRLSTLLLLAAAVLPDRGGSALARGMIRFYRRRITRFTPRCPSTPSCSAFALTAVRERGARRGLAAAARRIRDCGPTGAA